MIEALRRRRSQQEEGFTLIELMVVVLILAILMAIAIPTFLGARSGAQDRAAQSNLTNAVTAVKTIYTNSGGSFAGAFATDEPALSSAEPAIPWFTGSAANPSAASTTNQVYIMSDAAQAIEIGAKSGTGTCWYTLDIEQTQTTAIGGETAPGVYYAGSKSCTAPSAAANWTSGNGFGSAGT